jgi:hypothetical protein
MIIHSIPFDVLEPAQLNGFGYSHAQVGIPHLLVLLTLFFAQRKRERKKKDGFGYLSMRPT